MQSTIVVVVTLCYFLMAVPFFIKNFDPDQDTDFSKFGSIGNSFGMIVALLLYLISSFSWYNTTN
jgi:hypothetical protein